MSEVAGPVAVGERVQSDGDLQEAAGRAGLSGAIWRKSSWSAHNGNCVEVARASSGLIAVRDTKHAGYGPTLIFEAEAWGSFLNTLKNGDQPS